MMINEFGVPMNDAEMNLLPPGANKPHLMMLANSGMEMNFWGGVVGAVASAIFGRRRSSPQVQIVQAPPQQTRWEDTQQYRDFQAQNKQLTSQISGLESSLQNLQSSFNQSQMTSAGTIGQLKGQLEGYKNTQQAAAQAAQVASGYDVQGRLNQGVKINKGEDLGKTGKIKPTTRSYFNRQGMRIGSLKDQSVNV